LRRLIFAVFTSIVLFIGGLGLQPATAAGYPPCTITGTAANDTLKGTEGNDVICTGGGNDTVNALGGNDIVIVTAPGIDTINGGSGNDTIDATLGTDSTIDAGSGDDTVYGTPGDDEITAGDGADTVQGADGADVINGGLGDDNLSGDSGNDTITGDIGADTISGGDGNDTVQAGYGNDTVNGGAGDDNLSGEVGNDNLSGDAGNDTVNGGAGDDTISGGEGNDQLTGEADTDTITGEAGDDTINAGDGSDDVDAGNGDDTVTGGDGNDDINGSAGNDSITGDVGDDSLDGGAGNDTLNGTEGDDSLIGGEGADSLNGGSGADRLSGGVGNDNISGEAGDDSINGGDGVDTLNGSDGNDTLIGGLGADSLNGGLGSDQLGGDAGDDFLYGEVGTDTLSGGDGDDVLAGGSGIDSINGGNGLNTCDYSDNEIRTSTCAYDTAPAVLKHFGFNSNSIDTSYSSQSVGVSLGVTDVTGVDYLKVTCGTNYGGYFYRAIDFTYNAASGEFINDANPTSPLQLQVTGNARNLQLAGNVTVRRGQFPGIYSCQIESQDVAMNKVTLTSVATFSVVRSVLGFDDAAPEISNIGFSNTQVDSGTSTRATKLTLDISDATGAKWGYFQCEIWAGNANNRAIELGWTQDRVFDYKSQAFGTAVTLNPYTKRYSIDLTIKQGTPPGEYSCNFYSEDVLGNKIWANNVAKFTVIRSGLTFDSDPPIISVTSQNSTFDVGSTQSVVSLEIHQTDISGSAWSYLECGRIGGEGRFFHVGYRFDWGVYDYTTQKTLKSFKVSGSATDLKINLDFVVPFGYTPGHYTCSATVLDTLGLRADPYRLFSFDVLRTPSGQPSPPTSFVFSPINPNSGTLSWGDPLEKGNPLLSSYITQFSEDGSVWQDLQLGVTSSKSLNLTGLKADTDYWFRVRGENGGTLGQDTTFMNLNWSTLKARTPAPVVSDAPTGLLVTGVSSSGFTVDWSTPIYDGGALIVDFSVEVSRDGGTSWKSTKASSSTSTHLTVSGSAPGTTYLLRIAAVNAVGQSEYLTGAVATLMTAASPPKSLSVITLAETSVSLGWALPDSNGGSNITDYQVEVTSNGSNNWTVIPHTASNSLGFNVTNLIPGRTYQFRVSAVTSFGIGITSESIRAAVPPILPTAPSNLVISDVTSSNFSMHWNLSSADGGSVITKQIFQISPDGGLTWSPVRNWSPVMNSFKLSGAAPGKNYLLRIASVNEVGQSGYLIGSVDTLLTSSSAPQSLVSSNLTGTSLSLSWALPESNGGSGITDYQVEVTSSGSDSWTVIPHNASNSLGFNVSNLLPGRTYQFRVSAVTSAGFGEASSIITVTTLGTRSPYAPESIGVSGLKTNAASLSWSKVMATRTVTNYLVDVSTDGTTWVAVSKKVSTSNMLSLSGLKLGTNYQVRVAAVNSVGTGDYVYGSFTTLATVSTSPTALVSSNLSSSGFTLNWNAPASNGGAAITDYVVEINGGGFSWAPISHEVTGNTSITVTGLNPGIKYSVRVKAVNSVGASKVSSTLTVTTLATTPGTVTGLTVKSVTATGAVITWTAPSAGGAKISDYLVEVSTDNGQSWKTVIKTASSSTTLTIKGLKAKTSYLVRITAKNSVGYGSVSQSLAVTTS
jgi:Ca2+-binding RTX toxin-like protein